jgi:hypothetical protein
MLFTAALDALYAALPYKLLIRVTAPAKRSDVPEQIDVHHGLPVIQAIKKVALYRNCGIVEQYGNPRTRIKGVGTGKAPRLGKGGRERIPFFIAKSGRREGKEMASNVP